MTTIRQEEALMGLLLERWKQVSRKVADLAEVIPADQFDSRPLATVRNPGEVVRHLAFWNQYVADKLDGNKTDDAGNELPQAKYSTKRSMLEVLNRTSESVVAALHKHRDRPDLKTAELIMSFLEHTCEHYGQLVVYARLISIVPPASRT